MLPLYLSNAIEYSFLDIEKAVNLMTNRLKCEYEVVKQTEIYISILKISSLLP